MSGFADRFKSFVSVQEKFHPLVAAVDDKLSLPKSVLTLAEVTQFATSTDAFPLEAWKRFDIWSDEKRGWKNNTTRLLLGRLSLIKVCDGFSLLCATDDQQESVASPGVCAAASTAGNPSRASAVCSVASVSPSQASLLRSTLGLPSSLRCVVPVELIGHAFVHCFARCLEAGCAPEPDTSIAKPGASRDPVAKRGSAFRHELRATLDATEVMVRYRFATGCSQA